MLLNCDIASLGEIGSQMIFALWPRHRKFRNCPPAHYDAFSMMRPFGRLENTGFRSWTSALQIGKQCQPRNSRMYGWRRIGYMYSENFSRSNRLHACGTFCLGLHSQLIHGSPGVTYWGRRIMMGQNCGDKLHKVLGNSVRSDEPSPGFCSRC